MKIFIIGCSGTGKTYLAKALSQSYNIPHMDLDEIFWDNSSSAYGCKRSPALRDELLRSFLQNEAWVIEGVYYNWIAPVFEQADTIYILELPKFIYVSRILHRFVKRKLHLEPEKAGSIKSLIDLIKWTNKFQKQHMPKIRKILIPYQDKVCRIQSSAELNAIIKKERTP